MKLRPFSKLAAIGAIVAGVLGLVWWLVSGDDPLASRRLASAPPAALDRATLITANSAPSANQPLAQTLTPTAKAQAPALSSAAARLTGLNPELRFPPDAPAVTDRWGGARTVLTEDQPDPADPSRRFRVRIIEADFKHPLLRVEETLRVDSVSGTETLLAQVAMVADHVLLKPASGVSEQTFLGQITALGGTIRSRKPASGIYLITIPAPLELNGLPDALDQLKTLHGLVAIAEPDFIFHTSLTPNDPFYSQLYGLHNTGQSGGVADADIDAPEAWDISTGSREIVVGVIDTGIDHTHPDLAANMWTNPGEIAGNGIDDDGNGYVDDVRGWDFVNDDNDPMDDHFHGTHCAGTIGAVGGNGVGVVGVAHQVSLVGLKFLSVWGAAPPPTPSRPSPTPPV